MTETNTTKRPWAGYIITALPTLFLLMDAVMKFVRPEPVVETTVGLGYGEHQIVTIGAILLICLVLYLIPRTAVLGAVLLTGYLGGAVATNFRAETPLFTNILFPVYVGIFVWLGLYLRDAKLRELLPFRN
ncbi:MAG TPA: DoxX family protein [Pyrinomonadaceae bacterium]|nr:DoxX family protein [Pyrinomonadaceae bacterium]HMP66354.1 DoxX family protein [Pyrinomonadaceae bacterium]